MLNNYDPAKYIKRKLDLLIKGLPSGAQQRILERMNDQDADTMRCLAEKDIGYPTFKAEDCSDEYVRLCEEEAAEFFADIDSDLADNGRHPFFTDPEDTCASAKEYLDIMQERPYEELVSFLQGEE